jgi:lipopolysaccharide transport system permease protein
VRALGAASSPRGYGSLRALARAQPRRGARGGAGIREATGELQPAAAPTPARVAVYAPGAPRFDLAGALWTLVRTDFKVRYHGTFAGFVWAMLKPLAMFAVLMSVFTFVFSSKTDYALDLVLGLFLYDHFQEGTKTGLVSLHAKGYLIGRSRFPRWLLVVASTANPLLVIATASGAIVAFLALAGRAPSPTALALYAAYVALAALIVIGFSLAASVLFVRYRDLNQVWEVVVQAGFFVSPIVYPLDVLPEHLHRWLYLWPPTAVIEFSRSVLIEGVAPTAKAHLLLVLVAAGSLGVGSLVYRRLAPATAEYL